MNTTHKWMAALAFLLMLSNASYAQQEQDTTIYRIETRDGNEYLGRIIARDAEGITLLTEVLGELKIPVSSIKRIEQVASNRIIGGALWFENPQATRYFWAPNGYGLKKGEAYYQNVWILFNQVSVGVTDNFTIGLGTVPLFLFGVPTPVYVTPKFSIPVVKDKFNVGIGVLAGAVIGEEGASLGLLYGSTTFGSKDKNLSIGLGYGYADGELAKNPVINVSGMLRVGPRGYLITENYYFGIDGEAAGFFSFGGRKIVRKISIDFGGFIPYGADIFIVIPWLGISVPIGRKIEAPY